MFVVAESGQPVPVGWLHKGPVGAPTGGGHWSVIIGYKTGAWIVNDPNGEAKLVQVATQIINTDITSSTATRTLTHVGLLVVKVTAGTLMSKTLLTISRPLHHKQELTSSKVLKAVS